MRIIAEAYKHLGRYLKDTITDTGGNSAFRWVDMWWEQTDFPEICEGIDYPALFLDFASDDIKTIGELEQDITLRTTLYIAVNTLEDTHLEAAEAGQGLHYLELLARVQEELQAYQHYTVGSLTRIGFGRYGAATNILVYQLVYQSTVVDTSATDLRRATEPSPPDAITMGTRRQQPAPPAAPSPRFDIGL